jgi:hypothetical protein
VSRARDIPYQLRPNKFIDRQIFLDLLARVVPLRPDGDYIYVSMGGKHLVDQEAVYRRVGIRHLYSFDGDAGVVARQQCNKPLAHAQCVEMKSSALAGEIDSILEIFKPASKLIIWLDYTDPKERLAQLQELAECLKRAQPGDLVRITMNASDRTLNGDWKKEGYSKPSLYRAARLRDQIGIFCDQEIKEILEDQLAPALARSVFLACSQAEEEKGFSYQPVLITSYADGQRMITASVLVLESGGSLPAGLQDWEFLAKGWSDIVDISAPDLSLREKVAIDKHLGESPEEIIEAVKFAPASELDDAHQALMSYKKLHRFYPTFFAIGIQ